jgi:hypothetical protein
MPLVMFLVLLAIGTVLFVKLRNSKKIETFTYDLTHEKDFSKDTSELIGEAQKADEALVEKVEENKATIDRIKTETETIDKYRKVEPKEDPDEIE